MSDHSAKPTPVLKVVDLTKHFDGVTALDSFNLDVCRGEIVALIGPNGAGKTTLFNIITGFLRADSGRISLLARDISKLPPHRMVSTGVARTFQNLRFIGGITAQDNVLLSLPNQLGQGIVVGLTFKPRAVAQQEVANHITAKKILAQVSLADKASDLARNLSYGQQKLLTLACVIATGADILLLDEPVAGVAPQLIDSILETVRRLARSGKAIILIEHNIHAVKQLAHRAVFMDAGKKIAEGSPSAVLENKLVIEAYLE